MKQTVSDKHAAETLATLRARWNEDYWVTKKAIIQKGPLEMLKLADKTRKMKK